MVSVLQSGKCVQSRVRQLGIIRVVVVQGGHPQISEEPAPRTEFKSGLSRVEMVVLLRTSFFETFLVFIVLILLFLNCFFSFLSHLKCLRYFNSSFLSNFGICPKRFYTVVFSFFLCQEEDRGSLLRELMRDFILDRFIESGFPDSAPGEPNSFIGEL